MPRKARIIVPGAVHHVMARGLDRELIFRDDVDREKMLQLSGRYFLALRCACYAWVLMDNHYHFVVRPLEPNLATVMRRINGTYARYFNKRHDRRGYLFGDRYKSLATQELDYLRELIRYVHLNPLRAGIVDSIDRLKSYRWSGHRALQGGECYPWHDADSALKRFGNSRTAAQKVYLRFLEEGVGAESAESGWWFDRNGDVGEDIPNDERLAGDRDFIIEALGKVPRTRGFLEQIKTTRPELEKILCDTCATCGLSPETAVVGRRGEQWKRVRREFCSKANREYAYTVRELAEFLDVHASNVIRAMK